MRHDVQRPRCGEDSDDDRNLLGERLVPDSLRFSHLDENIFYSRDRTHREVGFVVGRKAGHLDTFECKINPDEMVAGAKQAYRVRRGGREFTVSGTKGLPGSGTWGEG